jgi:periplasmic divalent cation tolerance protein
MKYKIVFVTARPDEAENIAENIIKKKLAACVNIINKIKSIYWWNKKIEKDSESLLIFKTEKNMIEKLIDEIKKIHSYQKRESRQAPKNREKGINGCLNT